MHRFYLHCRYCHERMTMFSKDADRNLRFYLCRCGWQVTYSVQMNFIWEYWPEEIFDETVQQKVITSTGRVL